MLGPALVLAASFVVAPQGARPAASSRAAEVYYLFVMGLEAESNGDAKTAIELFKKASQIDPSSGEVLAELAAVYARQDQPREAIATAEAALKVAPDTVEAHWVLGTIYAAYAETEEPAHTDANRRALREYALKGITHLEPVAAARGAHVDAPLYLTLGRLYLVTANYDKAIALLQRMMQQEPGVLDAVAMLAEAYASSGRISDAIKLLEQQASREPAFYPVLAGLYERSGRWTDAADTYRKATQAGSDNVEIKRRWALALLNTDRKGDAAAARDLLLEIVSADAKDTRALYMLAQAYRHVADYTAAEATARKLMAIDPEGVSGPYALSQVYEQQRQFQKEIDTLQPLVDRLLSAPTPGRTVDVPALLVHLSEAYVQIEQPDRALAELQRGREKFPTDTSVIFQIGAVLERQKRYADAERAFRDVIARDPLNGPALNYLGFMLADRGDRLSEALELIQRALAVEPGNPAYLDSLGWAYFKMDRLDEAETNLRAAASARANDSAIQEHWGDVLMKRGRIAEAVAAWRRALAGDGESIDRAAIEDKVRKATKK